MAYDAISGGRSREAGAYIVLETVSADPMAGN